MDVAGLPHIIGHEWAVQLIQRGLALGRTGHSYLLAGPPRIGKTTFALYLAQALNCTSPENRPCGVCSACQKIAKGVHPDVRVIDEPGSSIKIDQIRDLQREASISPYEGRYRVYILCDVQQAGAPAANCLLKTLEEPPPKVVLILTATEAAELLPTIVSRCQVLHFRPLAADQVQRNLEDLWHVEPERARLLSRLSEGRMGWAIEACSNDGLLRSRDKYFVALEQALQCSGSKRTERMSLAQQLSQNPQMLPDVLSLWQSWWRDVMLAKSGNVGALANVDREQTLSNEAQHLSWNEITGCLRAIDHAAQQIEQNVNPCLALEVLLLKMPDPDSVSVAQSVG